jgi:transcriptional regulator with XRE-family HTH domain
MRLLDLALAVRKPEDRSFYSPGFISRLERGRASAPLYTYLAIADALDVEAGVLLGPDAALLETSEAEVMLLRCLRSLGIAPHDAMTALVAVRPAPPE